MCGNFGAPPVYITLNSCNVSLFSPTSLTLNRPAFMHATVKIDVSLSVKSVTNTEYVAPHSIQYCNHINGETWTKVPHQGGASVPCLNISRSHLSAQRSALTYTLLLALKRYLSGGVAAKDRNRDPRLRCSLRRLDISFPT